MCFEIDSLFLKSYITYTFCYILGTDGSDSGINGKEEDEANETTKMNNEEDEEEEEAKRIAELGKPRLGENCTLEIIIEESYEFKVSFFFWYFDNALIKIFLIKSLIYV